MIEPQRPTFGLLRRFPVDALVLVVVGAIVAATLFPAHGAAVVDVTMLTKAAIAALFVLYGARLSPAEARRGLGRWRLHTLILASTFVVFPVLGLLARALCPWMLPDDLYTGLLFLCLVPSTTLSSIALTSVARGSVADSVIGASVSNLLGMFLTPLLVLALMRSTGEARVDTGVVVGISLQLLLPFVVGQLLRRRLSGYLAAHSKHIRLLERSALALVVYSAFTAGVDDHVWSSVSLGHLAAVILVGIGLLAAMLVATTFLGRVARLPGRERIVLQFCGVQKSLATGIPMALIMFSGPHVGLVVLPLIVFYQIQVLVNSMLAAHYARSADVAEVLGPDDSGPPRIDIGEHHTGARG